ncbi:MAG: 3-methyl-2-oxobutanoate dehydrogenase [Candidatus Sericytochromatia bacterium]|uniref:2-oxoisovalerate dehydrogenase subunit alpha n=1 Tax=Candidatus Tanganyikabacteria bacterium TaxID=2961651 RepID=A0A937X411_9BACT|nr:3-methyl-2-oxobutanoate dehydrogenase [Candidatus Tanganyikabacteria bacterium]
MREINHRAIMLQRQGRIGSWLGSEGQEATAVGAGHALEPDDWAYPTYREHALALVRGVPVVKLFHHLYGNAADNAKGRNLPPEYSFREINFVSISAPVGNQTPQAVGTAIAARKRGDKVAVLTFFGDGTSSEGDVHVAMEFAARFKAPVVFFCQNNGWAISVPTHRQMAAQIADRAPGYGFEGWRIDGNDPLEVYDATKAALEKARSGGGPTLIEAVTYRLGAHSTSDDPSKYRAEDEVQAWHLRDPIHVARERLGLSEAEDENVWEWARAEVQAAIDEAESIPRPEVPDMFEEVYAHQPWHLAVQRDAHMRHLGGEGNRTA